MWRLWRDDKYTLIVEWTKPLLAKCATNISNRCLVDIVMNSLAAGKMSNSLFDQCCKMSVLTLIVLGGNRYEYSSG